MRKVTSCGILIFRRKPELTFLLLKKADRYDLPKGHLEAGETEIECALRELREETGITADQVTVDDDFRYVSTYYPVYKRFNNETVEKQVIIFLGWVDDSTQANISNEHIDFEWHRWNPPHDGYNFNNDTIIGVLEAVADEL